MDLRSSLEEGFAYDNWANAQWIEAISRLADSAQATHVMKHILWAQETWASRVSSGCHLTDISDLSERLINAQQWWLGLIGAVPLGKVIAYKNSSGVGYGRQFGAIARHVIDHGTYHRGQLRQIFGEHGREDFPETGLMGFFIVSELHGEVGIA